VEVVEVQVEELEVVEVQVEVEAGLPPANMGLPPPPKLHFYPFFWHFFLKIPTFLNTCIYIA